MSAVIAGFRLGKVYRPGRYLPASVAVVPYAGQAPPVGSDAPLRGGRFEVGPAGFEEAIKEHLRDSLSIKATVRRRRFAMGPSQAAREKAGRALHRKHKSRRGR